MGYLDKDGLIHFWSKIVAKFKTKVDKVDGKGLSTNDFTTEEKTKLQNIEEGANKIVVDTALAANSTNPVENKAIYNALSSKMDSAANVSIDKLVAGETNSTIPSSLLPSYVDDALEYDSQSSFPAQGESGKIYIDKTSNLTYRWSGSGYVEISPSLALGETSSTAYRGDLGAAAYAHAQEKGSAFASGLYKITTNSQGHITSAIAVAKSDLTALSMLANDSVIDGGTWS